MDRLKRTLGITECIFFGVGSILGAGIYTLIGKIAGFSGHFIWLSLLITSVAAMFTALSYAELSAAFPKAGGEYIYAKKAFGKTIGTLMGILISLNGIIVGSTVAIGFAGYLSTLVGLDHRLGILGILSLIFLINLMGIKQSSWVNILFTTIEVGGLVIVIYFSSPYFGSVDYLEMPSGGPHAILAGSALAFFAYVGFEEIVKLAEETTDPQKNIPRALLTANFIVMIVYLLVGVSVVSVIPFSELAQSQSPLADVLLQTYGKSGVVTISIIALFATSNTILSNMIGSSRVLLEMAPETPFIHKLSFISPNKKTPVVALLSVFILSLLFAQIGNIEQIARVSTVFIFMAFTLIHLAVIVLRVKNKDLNRPFRIPLNYRNVPIPTVLGLFMTVLLLGYTVHALFSPA